MAVISSVFLLFPAVITGNISSVTAEFHYILSRSWRLAARVCISLGFSHLYTSVISIDFPPSLPPSSYRVSPIGLAFQRYETPAINVYVSLLLGLFPAAWFLRKRGAIQIRVITCVFFRNRIFDSVPLLFVIKPNKPTEKNLRLVDNMPSFDLFLPDTHPRQIIEFFVGKFSQVVFFLTQSQTVKREACETKLKS